MIPIRVLIAGNSVVARRLLVRAIDAMESAMSLGSSANLRVTLARPGQPVGRPGPRGAPRLSKFASAGVYRS